MAFQKSLNIIGLENNTDKASLDRSRVKSLKKRDGHNFLVKYEAYLNHLREAKLNMLELGAGPLWNCGASARMWETYFSNASKIEIAEINPAARKIETDKITTRIGDLGNLQFLHSFLKNDWDFIIDDASHIWWHQILGLKVLFQSLKPGGIYIIEDIHTSFGDLRSKYDGESGAHSADVERVDAATLLSVLALCVAGKNRSHPIIDLKMHADWLSNIADDLASITFINHSVILVKKGDANEYLNFSGK